MRAAVAAGHPATVDAGIEILEDGGNAADAAVAACLASCVAETVMTGLLGGGHAAVLWDGTVRMLDCFVSVPGLGAERRELALEHLEVPFGSELVHYAVGIGSCAVPGVLPGLDELKGSGFIEGRLSKDLTVPVPDDAPDLREDEDPLGDLFTPLDDGEGGPHTADE
jgi:gamma-glutamyltranspeptidase